MTRMAGYSGKDNEEKTVLGRLLFSVFFFSWRRILILSAHFAKVFSSRSILRVMFFNQLPVLALYITVRPFATERLSCIDLHYASSAVLPFMKGTA